jgi:hypothetical protein
MLIVSRCKRLGVAVHNEDHEDQMLTLFQALRKAYQGEYGTELAIIENEAYQVVRLRSRIGMDRDRPRFSIVIRSVAAGITITHRQRGYAANPPHRQTLREDQPGILDRVVATGGSHLADERKRLIDFREAGN